MWASHEREYVNEYCAKYYENKKSKGICKACNKPKTTAIYCEEHRIYYRRKVKEYNERLRNTVYSGYGNKCVCCKETNWLFLTIDHKFNNGAAHRRELFPKGFRQNDFYKWIIKNRFPNTLQLLCLNCNMGKQRNGGICPHDNDILRKPSSLNVSVTESSKSLDAITLSECEYRRIGQSKVGQQ